MGVLGVRLAVREHCSHADQHAREQHSGVCASFEQEVTDRTAHEHAREAHWSAYGDAKPFDGGCGGEVANGQRSAA